MGYDLQNVKGNTFRFSIWGYSPVLTLAEEYGWEPKGTVLDAEDGWDGGYTTNDGQKVGSTDAKGIAKALSKALDDIPDEAQEHPLGTKTDGTMDDLQKKILEMHSLTGNKLLSTFSGRDRKAGLYKFIDFLKEGAYETY
jgi:hypothetical protein